MSKVKEWRRNLAFNRRVEHGGEPSITVGQTVTGELDWDRRYRIMRTHTAMHILCGVVWRDYGASVTGGNMDPDLAAWTSSLKP